MTNFTFECDPGHGWLLVSAEDMTKAGLTEADISPFSYVSKTGQIALEEDLDAGVFLDAWKEKFGQPRISDEHVETTAIRNWKSYGTKSTEVENADA